ncbi:single-stranded DNA-binding protein [Roseibacillus ishigakijimensis]|uniref:Single-stranded DNA-binding protein n=1 Tax=Roseibacillus ishigakijimensis TaxID=454146 RepID=A0A934RMA5_9BACT|nr:single-stranded DNA-binding protein [Roseibacillus ishigakijimensis]MBK1833438.1 single-stranded DNA-binding protein [Roseibacillus ishigakijimensis]
MANLNKVYLMGRLTRDPELRYTPKGTAVADIGMAINRYRGGGDGGERTEETTFVDVTLWGRQAEIVNQYLAKGREVFIEGRLQLDSWEDKASGQKRSKLKVVGESMQFIGGPGGSGGSSGGEGGNYSSSNSGYQSGGQESSSPDQGASSSQGSGSYDDEEEDDIPF